MKKFYLLFISVVLLSCLCLFTACNKELSKNSDVNSVTKTNSVNSVKSGNSFDAGALISYRSTDKSGEDAFEIELNEDGKSYKVFQYVGLEKEIVIPSTHLGKPVEAIGGFAFSDCNTIQKVTLPDTIKKIESYAFNDCQELENVLYEYHFNFFNFIQCFIPIGMTIIFKKIYDQKILDLNKKLDVNKTKITVDIKITKIFFVSLMTLFIALFIVTSSSYLYKYFTMKSYYNSENCMVVVGEVTEFHPMPAGGHDDEHFLINGVYFEYSDFEFVNGYHNAASHGGVITHNGQKLKIKYYPDKKKNVILYIAEI